MRLVFAVLLLAGCGDTSPYDLDGGDLLIVGRKFVEKRQCPMCHDPEAPGAGALSGRDTPLPGLAAGVKAYPPNLTPDPETGIGNWADITIIRAMRYGVDDEQEELCPTMPRASDMTDLEANAIVAYLRSIPAVTHKVPESECPPLKPKPELDMSVPPVEDMSQPPDLMSIDGGG